MNKKELLVDVVKALFLIGLRAYDQRKQRKEEKKGVDEGHGLG